MRLVLFAGNKVHQHIDQALHSCTIPNAMAISINVPNHVQCILNPFDSMLTVFTGSLDSRNVHFSAHIAYICRVLGTADDSHRLLSHPHAAVSTNKYLQSRHATHCFADVHVCGKAFNSGYLAHPTIVDNCLHMGAIMAAKKGGSSTQAYIPTAIDGFMVIAPHQQAARAHAYAEVNGAESKPFALSSYRMQQEAGIEPSGFQLVDLHAQAARFTRSFSNHKDGHKEPSSLTYTIQWQHHAPTHVRMPRKKSLKHQIRHTWLDEQFEKLFGETTKLSKSLAASSLADIALIQSMLNLSLPRHSINLISIRDPLSNSIMPMDSPSLMFHQNQYRGNGNAVAHTIARVAASEYPEHVWSALMASPLSIELPMVPDNIDAFGVNISGRAIQFPRVLPAREKLPSLYGEILPKRVIISGGLNGMGASNP